MKITVECDGEFKVLLLVGEAFIVRVSQDIFFFQQYAKSSDKNYLLTWEPLPSWNYEYSDFESACDWDNPYNVHELK